MGATLKPDSDKIKSLRILRGWPQEQLARIADVSPRTIQRMESGGNASFETLRAVAGAFELEVQELMKRTARLTEPEPVRESPPRMQVQPRDGRGSLVAKCVPYVPLLRMMAGALVLAMAASAAIRLSPFLAAYLDQRSPIVGSGASESQDSLKAPAVSATANRQGTSVETDVSTTAGRYSSEKRAPVAGTGRAVPQNITRDGSLPSAEPRALLEGDGGAQASVSTILVDRLAGVPAPELVARGRSFELPDVLGAGLDSSIAGAGVGSVPAGAVSGGADEERGAVIRSLVRSGRGTASFLTKAGDSLRRVF